MKNRKGVQKFPENQSASKEELKTKTVMGIWEGKPDSVEQKLFDSPEYMEKIMDKVADKVAAYLIDKLKK